MVGEHLEKARSSRILPSNTIDVYIEKFQSFNNTGLSFVSGWRLSPFPLDRVLLIEGFLKNLNCFF